MPVPANKIAALGVFEMNRIKAILLFSAFWLGCLDLMTTNVILNHGMGEANPFMRLAQEWLGAWWLIPKLGLTLVIVGLSPAARTFSTLPRRRIPINASDQRSYPHRGHRRVNRYSFVDLHPSCWLAENRLQAGIERARPRRAERARVGNGAPPFAKFGTAVVSKKVPYVA